MNKTLVLDIETRPTTAYVWQLYDVDISLEQIVDAGGVLCFGAKWLDSSKTLFYSDWQHGHARMVKEAHKLLCEAEAVITYNGDRFDLPKLKGEFLVSLLPPPPPLTSIDVIKIVRKMGLLSSKLGFVGPFIQAGEKVKHEGFSLWKNVIAGQKSAQKNMQKYCLQDVLLLEKVYKKLLPYIHNHPRLIDGSAEACGACGKHRLQRRGLRRTKSFSIQRLQCQACGSWRDGEKKKAA